MKTSLCTIVGAFLTVLSPLSINANEQVYRYETEVKGSISSEEWNIKEANSQLSIIGRSEDSTTLIECSKDYSFYKYDYRPKNQKNFLIISLNGKSLNVSQNKGDKSDNKTYTIHKPWIQEFAFGLIPFVKSQQKSLTFVIVDPKDLTLHTLIAKRASTETITIKGKEFKAEKIIITLPGLKGKFWKAYAWFDTTTYQYLKYEGNEGPGTPTSVTVLIP